MDRWMLEAHQAWSIGRALWASARPNAAALAWYLAYLEEAQAYWDALDR